MHIDPLSIKSGSERTLYLLAILARLEKAVRIQDLIQETGFAQSTIYRQLALLKKWGFVVEVDGNYTPGPMCLPLAWGFDQSSYLIEHAHPELQQLAQTSGESVGLFVVVNHHGVCLDMVESRQSLRCSFSKARSFPLTKGATAKALLGAMQATQRQTVLDRLVHESYLTPQASIALQAQVTLSTQQNHTTSDGEVDAGIWGVSTPLAGVRGQGCAVITLMAPSSRVSERAPYLIDLTLRSAHRISRCLQSL